MKFEVKKIGNSLGIILSKDALQELGLAQGDCLFATKQSDGSFALTPYDPEFAESMQIVDDVMDEYRDTLRELAK